MRLKTIISCFLLSMLMASAASAMTLLKTNEYSLATEQELITETLVLANKIEIAGPARNDLFLVATPGSSRQTQDSDGSITLTGIFENDVWSISKRLDFSGEIRDHARFAAQTVVCHGTINNSAVMLGNTVHVARGADLGGDVLIIGENIIVEGCIEGNLTLIGKNVTLAGKINGDVDVIAQDLVALPGTEISGNLNYRTAKRFSPSSQVKIHGKVTDTPLAGSAANDAAQGWIYQIWLAAGAFLSGIIFLLLLPRAATRVVLILRHSLWRCLLVGGMTLCLSPLIVALAIISIVGIPFALLYIAALTALVYLSKIVVAIVLGLWFTRSGLSPTPPRKFLALFLGLVVLYIGTGSGAMGLFMWAIITSAGLGSLLLALISGTPPLLVMQPGLSPIPDNPAQQSRSDSSS